MATVLELAEGDLLIVGQVTIRVGRKNGRKARLSIDAPATERINVHRNAPATAAIVAGEGVVSIQSTRQQV